MRAALLINFVAPYRVKLFEHVRGLLGELRIMVSTPMEADRHWVPSWGTLDVVVQRTITLRRHMRDVTGFDRTLQIHFPLDTLPRLFLFRPDVVISVELGLRSLQAVLYKRLRPRVPLIIWCKLSEHSERSWGGLRLWLRRLILNHANAVLVNGESGARYIGSLGVTCGPIVRLNQTVEVTRFNAVERAPPPQGIVRLLHVGHLNVRKGVVPFARTLILWAQHNPERTVEITWLGDGENRAELEAMCWPGNLRAAFLGNLPYDDVPEVYGRNDILVFPTLLDEWGLVVNEAMASGMPVLGSRYSQAVEELVVPGVNGWVFDALKEEDVTQALNSALATPAGQLAAMGEAARQRSLKLTPQATAAGIAALVYDLVGKAPADRSQYSPGAPSQDERVFVAPTYHVQP